MSKLQNYLESGGIQNNRFSPEQLAEVVDKMKKMAPALLKQIAKEDGYLDVNFVGCKFIDLHFESVGLVAHYTTPFRDEGKLWKGDTYVTWNGKKLSIDFGGSADETGEEDD
jgi:hypothetical protein